MLREPTCYGSLLGRLTISYYVALTIARDAELLSRAFKEGSETSYISSVVTGSILAAPELISTNLMS